MRRLSFGRTASALSITLAALSPLAAAPLAGVAACGGGAPADPAEEAQSAVGNDAGPGTACPPGLGPRWSCDGANRRVRCVDQRLQVAACANGCNPGGDGGDAYEASCSCGEKTGYSRWNCTPEGDVASCAGGIGWVVQSCGGKGCALAGAEVSDTCRADGTLQTRVSALGASCADLVPGVRCSISLLDLTTGEAAQHEGNVLSFSASSAKAVWVGAALYDRSIDEVEPHVDAVFKRSDNAATGHVIDLLSSPARLNTFTWRDARMPDAGFCQWSVEKKRVASNCPNAMGGDNFFTADDAVSFLSQVWDYSLLGREKSQALLSWMTLSPRQGYGGWLGTQLPNDARATMHHKAGWLPPASVPGYSTSNEIGIVEIPGGHVYAVALLLNGAHSQVEYDDRQLPLLEYLSCATYHAVAADGDAACVAP